MINTTQLKNSYLYNIMYVNYFKIISDFVITTKYIGINEFVLKP